MEFMCTNTQLSKLFLLFSSDVGLLVEWLTRLTYNPEGRSWKGSVNGFDPGQGTYKNLWISCEYKGGLSDETKNRGPLYLSVK
jgi:hypothetical protein